jgi:hypothetical protein
MGNFIIWTLPSYTVNVRINYIEEDKLGGACGTLTEMEIFMRKYGPKTQKGRE